MECPNCGAYNPEDRTQCWKCDDLLPIKKEEPKKANEPGRMGMLTWVVLIVLGAIYLFNQCAGQTLPQPTSMQAPPAPVVRPLI
ncbi:MAG: hypothetical protein GXX93_09085 [Anaerolineae bacterium]|nr:hypothetical protein [Anaerolineae bacterium]